ncbi:MAG: DNA-directed RNA polymerase subunit omega [Firmicutes bacterium]|nr:DNA-directed RNA polymerase subunit omega [Bacillota bacterium]
MLLVEDKRVTIDELVAKIDNKYALVVTAAKRARAILEERGDQNVKPVTQALQEIAAGKITYEPTREGIK